MNIEFYGVDEVQEELAFVVIMSRYQGRWVFVQHRERTTWEMPGGHIEAGESVYEAAKRELWEESGATEFELYPICEYSYEMDQVKSYGRLYFAEISKLGVLPDLEIHQVMLNENLPKELTYPEVMPHLYNKVLESKVVIKS